MTTPDQARTLIRARIADAALGQEVDLELLDAVCALVPELIATAPHIRILTRRSGQRSGDRGQGRSRTLCGAPSTNRDYGYGNAAEVIEQADRWPVCEGCRRAYLSTRPQVPAAGSEARA